MWTFIRKSARLVVNPCLVVFLLLMPSTRCLMITEKADSMSTPSPIKYRVSLPRGERPLNRVPPHLQDIRTAAGFVDDDADDVIHIIEPPDYFELLKMLVQQRMLPNAEIGLNKSPTSDHRTQHAQQVGLQAGRPRRHGAEEMTALAPRKGAGRPASKPPQQPPNGGLPLELVASVRKVERLIQKGRPSIKPFIKQRIQTKKLQTVLTEQGYVQKQYERGQQLQQSGVKLKRTERVRRSVEETEEKPDDGSNRVKKSIKSLSDSDTKSANEADNSRKSDRKMRLKENNNNLGNLIKLKLQEFFHKKADSAGLNQNREHGFTQISWRKESPPVSQPGKLYLPKGYLSRRKRELSRNETKVTTTTANKRTARPKSEPYRSSSQLRGNELLDHITVLLNKATHHIADPPEMTARSFSNTSTLLNHFGHDWQLRANPKELIGEIDPVEMKAKQRNVLKQKQIQRILQSSVNATNAIMEGLMLVKNASKFKKSVKSHDNNHNHSASEGIRELSLPLSRRLGENHTEKHAGDKRQKTNHEPEVDILKETSTKSTISSLSMLYSDVMNNIRNMLQAKNLSDLEEELQRRKLHRKRLLAADVDLVLQPPPKVLIEDVNDATGYGEFRNLNKYLSELQSIVKDFVDPATTELVLNTYEYTSSTAPPSSAPITSSSPTIATTSKATAAANDWYLINGDGRIYQTHLTGKQRPTVSIFHRFPDIPNAELHLRNRTELRNTMQKKV